MKYTTINIQGNLISEEILQKVESGEAQGQTVTDFGFEPGANIRSEIEYAWSRIKLDWKHFSEKSQNLPASDPYGTALSRRWMEQFLDSLGFHHTRQKSNLTGENNQGYHISHTASNRDDLPIHIVGFMEPDKPDKNTLDIKTSGGTSRLSPHATVQEYLNVTEHLFGIATNGLHLRLIRDSGRLIKLTYLEFDLKRMLDEDKYSEFTLLFRLLHASRFPHSKSEADQCLLEKYYQNSIDAGNRIRNGLSLAVKESLVALGNGLLNQPENEDLREAYRRGELSAYELNHQLLRLIYRLLFLMVTEERGLIFDTGNESDEQRRNKEIYYRFYSLARLRKLSESRYIFEQQYTDLWQGLMQTFGFFEPGSKGIRLGIHPLGSELFQHTAIQHISQSLVNNRVLLECIRNLNEFEDIKKNRVLINFRSLDVEELGSIYEGLLELAPVITTGDGQEYHFTYEKGGERSTSGSHYTPEDLVKPLIQHSLEYLIEERVTPFYRGKASAGETTEKLLNLKVCDVACGSGHILLSAARRIAQEVARVETGEQQPNPNAFRNALKRVISHCIYGVDKNPLAVELCKVALWLESHNPGKPLNFLDHHIKCGDAIVGLGQRNELENGIADEAFKTLADDDKEISKAFRDKNVKERKARTTGAGQQLTLEQGVDTSVQETMTEYQAFNQLPETTPEEIERKVKAYKKFMDGKGPTFLKAMADTQEAQFFIPKIADTKDYLMTDADFRLILSGYKGWQDRKVAKAASVAFTQRFFHWFIEFPEVFHEGGFDCILGNPPFLGGQKLSGAYGPSFLEYIKYAYKPIGAVDLVTYFFRKIFTLLKPGGFQSLISTNTIAQGSAREGGLDVICSNGGIINHAVKSMRWPGKAAVEVALVTIHKGPWNKDIILDAKKVDRITPYLDDSEVMGNPFPLKANSNKSFQGSIVLGKGFVLTTEEAQRLINKDPRNKDVLFPYLNGDDLNNDPEQKPSRWVINFFDWPEEKARTYPDCFAIVEQFVKPERLAQNDKVGREKWWRFLRARNELYETISKLDQVMVVPLVSKYSPFDFAPTNIVYMHKLGVIVFSDFHKFAVLSSSLHNIWCWKNSSTLGSGTLNYSTTDCFETYPFPNEDISNNLDLLGKEYYTKRKALMEKSGIGLTKMYNQLHNNGLMTIREGDDFDKKRLEQRHGKGSLLWKNHLQNIPSIAFNETVRLIEELRVTRRKLDSVVLAAYGWSDIQLRHDFYELEYLPENDRIRFTIHPEARKEILNRLLKLNHQLHTIEMSDKTKIENHSKQSKFKNNPSNTLF
ncbi:DNA methyltransferase [Leadbetterella sp. DM7]|uniref:Eco57I restriction-modification methylase domain-containing protein n=1 Tax=Leadbetterella sp. DM7 TaxID=3235085 RepID=UPI00349EB002